MDGRVREVARDMQKALDVEIFYVSLLENPGGFPSYFLGIDGQLRRNECAYRLAHKIHCNLVTYKDAIIELRKFSNDIIEKGWVQLSLWSQLELDQL